MLYLRMKLALYYKKDILKHVHFPTTIIFHMNTSSFQIQMNHKNTLRFKENLVYNRYNFHIYDVKKKHGKGTRNDNCIADIYDDKDRDDDFMMMMIAMLIFIIIKTVVAMMVIVIIVKLITAIMTEIIIIIS